MELLRCVELSFRAEVSYLSRLTDISTLVYDKGSS